MHDIVYLIGIFVSTFGGVVLGLKSVLNGISERTKRIETDTTTIRDVVLLMQHDLQKAD